MERSEIRDQRHPAVDGDRLEIRGTRLRLWRSTHPSLSALPDDESLQYRSGILRKVGFPCVIAAATLQPHRAAKAGKIRERRA
jgi:hypothetical protein